MTCACCGGGSGFLRFLQGREPVCQHFQGLAQCLEHTGCFLKPMPPSAGQGEGVPSKGRAVGACEWRSAQGSAGQSNKEP